MARSFKLGYLPLFANVFQIRCSYKFLNIHTKTPVLESLFDNVVSLFLQNTSVAASAVLKNSEISQENIIGGGLIDLSF